jgi:predicted Fe-Mo cluster-binding NifX family protein
MMNIFFAVADDAGLESKIDARFGRAAYFLVYDPASGSVVSCQANTFKDLEHGAGIKTATFAVESGCKVAVGAQPGPKAADILAKGGMEFIVADDGSVKDVVEKYRSKWQQ